MTEKNPFDDILSESPAEDAKAPAKEPAAPKAEKKAKADDKPAAETKTRRTKEEKLADDIDAAKTLLLENGFTVFEADGEAEDDEAPEEDLAELFTPVVAELAAISATEGQITGTVDSNNSATPILRLSLTGWVGTPPVEVPARDGFRDIEKVLKELKRQAQAHHSE